MTSFLPSARYPIGTVPPIHIPFLRDAATLSLTRSAPTSRSNWANESNTLRVSRPMLLVVLKLWVTETKETPRASKRSTMRAKSVRDRVSRSTL
jgi:hypothetical protein